MKSFLLLVLSLMTGFEVSSQMKGCEGGWVELTCKYPKGDQKYQKIEVINHRGSSIQTTKKDVWDGDDRFSLYHDTRNKNLRIAIKQIEHDNSGKYNCKFYQTPESYEEQEQELELKVAKDGCQTPFNQTVYETAKTTITCDFPKKYSYVKFICKDNNETCEEILSTQSSVKSNGTFTLTDTNRFNMSISDVSSQHAGVYWCGVKSKEGSYRASLRKIQLEIKTPTPPTPTPTPTTTTGVVIAAVLLLLLLVIIVTFIYKRFSSSRKTRRNEAAAQHVKVDNIYEEVQKRPQETGSGNAVKTVYATANFPTNPSDSMHYSTITFQSSTDKANSEVLIHKPSSSACEYSTVKNSQSPIYSTVYEPSKTLEDQQDTTAVRTQARIY